MLKVLVIENDRELICEYEKTLIDEGFKVIKAHDGQEGLNKFHNDKFDLVLANLQVPKLSGKKLVTQLQGPSSHMYCPLFVFGESLDTTLEPVLSTDQRIQFLQKPIDKKALVDRIKNLHKKPLEPAAKMDVRFVNPVLEATVRILQELTQFNISVGKPFLKTDSEASGDISGIVGVVSTGFRGTISLSFPEKGYLQIVSAMLGEETPAINDENKDAVAEILNMIFGQAKKTLNDSGMDIKSAIPTVIRGPQHIIEHHAHHPTIVIPFSSPEIGSFRSEVSTSSS